MPNYSSSSVATVDWAMGFDANASLFNSESSPSVYTTGSQTVKKRNLLENLATPSDSISPTPSPPPFQDFITLVNTKKRAYTNSSLSSISSDGGSYLPHQTPSPQLDHTHYKYGTIRARPLFNFKYNDASIWTQSSSNSVHSLLNNSSFDTNVVNKFFVKETKPSTDTVAQRSRCSSTSTTSSTTSVRPFQLLDKSSQITYDVTMRHLSQLLAKGSGKSATIDDVLHGIDTGNVNIEWLQCVQRLNRTLNKQFEKRPGDRLKLESYDMDNLDALNLVEQFLVRLVRIPHYTFKLNCYHYRDELQAQLILLSQSIDRLTHGIDLVLHHAYLPGIFQLLCFLYNIVSNKCVPGLDLISSVDAINSPTNQSNKTVAHVLTQILDEYYPEYLTHAVNDEKLTELKSISSLKHEKIYAEIRELHQQYQQLAYEYARLANQGTLPSFIPSMLAEGQVQFDSLFQQERAVKQGERNLAAYFCSDDLTIELCLSTVGQFVDKLRVAHGENQKEKKRPAPITTHQHKHTRYHWQ